SGGRALSEFRIVTHFFNDRVSFSSSRDASTLVPFQEYRPPTRGFPEQFRFNSVLLKSDFVKFSIDGASSAVGPNYWGLTNAPATDSLLARNRETQQFRSNLNVGRFG